MLHIDHYDWANNEYLQMRVQDKITLVTAQAFTQMQTDEKAMTSTRFCGSMLDRLILRGRQ